MPSLNETMIAQAIATLLSHYWTGSEDEALRTAQARDWVSDLCQFPAATVIQSCALWRRSQTKRPLPADIVTLCREMHSTIPRDRQIDSAETMERRREVTEFLTDRNYLWSEAERARNQWAVERGCKNFAEAMVIGIQTVDKRAIVTKDN